MEQPHEAGNPTVTADNPITDLLAAPLPPDWTVELLAEQVLAAIATDGPAAAQGFELDANATTERQSRRLLRPLLACLAFKSAAESGTPANLYSGSLSFKRPGPQGAVWIVGRFENRPGTVRIVLRRSSLPPQAAEERMAPSLAPTDASTHPNRLYTRTRLAIMSSSIDETDIVGYPELEPDVGEEVQNSDAHPVSSQPNDWNTASLRDKCERGQIDLQPHYQREYVWELKPELPSRLIESVLLEIPVPPIYFGKMPGARLEVIDGQQRLTTLIRFVRNEFHLNKLQRLGSLIGKHFRDLSEEYQAKLLDAPIRSVVIDAGNDQTLRYEVFERLNRGAMGLNEQELRNCVYRGSFCDLLAVLERDITWA
jgi:hypothetical protein